MDYGYENAENTKYSVVAFKDVLDDEKLANVLDDITRYDYELHKYPEGTYGIYDTWHPNTPKHFDLDHACFVAFNTLIDEFVYDEFCVPVLKKDFWGTFKKLDNYICQGRRMGYFADHNPHFHSESNIEESFENVVVNNKLLPFKVGEMIELDQTIFENLGGVTLKEIFTIEKINKGKSYGEHIRSKPPEFRLDLTYDTKDNYVAGQYQTFRYGIYELLRLVNDGEMKLLGQSKSNSKPNLEHDMSER
ncbi:MAG: hypothetical protein LUD48_05815 [Prevotella sp.]|nr:hypothetical protein [Prevotella sp.]